MASYALRRTASALVVAALVVLALAAVAVSLHDENPRCAWYAGSHPACSDYPPPRSFGGGLPHAIRP